MTLALIENSPRCICITVVLDSEDRWRDRLSTQQRGELIAVPTGGIWKAPGLILRRVGGDKPMGVYTGVALMPHKIRDQLRGL
jgi:hypothetical protein